MSLHQLTLGGSRRRVAVALGAVVLALLAAGTLAYVYRGHVRALMNEARTMVSLVRPIDDRSRVGAAGDGAFSVLLIVLDACRADKLGAYGFDRDTSPAIDAVARDPDAVTFLNHYAQASWTKPSTASLLTGLFPSDHGVVIGHIRASEDAEHTFQTQLLSPDVVTMAETLKEAGFYTFGVVPPHHLADEYGFSQGFAEYHGDTYGGDRLRLAKATETVEAVTGRYFGYVHFIGCHAAFPPHERDPEYMARHGFEYDEAARKKAGVDFGTVDIANLVNHGDVELSDDDARFLHLVYEAKMRLVDQLYVKPLIQGLKDNHRYDDTLIIITADHGEELYEHGGLAHGHALWDEVIRIPLIVKYPKGKRPQGLDSRTSALTSSVDLYPSILALAGLPAPRGVRGVAALHGVFAGQAFVEQAVGCSPQHVKTCRFQRALINDGFKLSVGPGTPPALFRLTDRPAEQRSLAAEFPDRVASMRSRIAHLENAGATKVIAPSVDIELGKEGVETLRGLGYIQ